MMVALLNEIEGLDDEIITLLLRRAVLGSVYQTARQRAGLPASELAWQNRVLGRYGNHLGRKGIDIGMAVLALPSPAV